MVLNHQFLMRGFQSFLFVALLGLFTGCQKEAEEAEAEEDSAPQAVSSDGLELSPEAQEAIGLETVQVSLRETQETMIATGWLAARPGGEVVVKAPITGFVTTEDSPLVLGQAVLQNQPLAKLHAFLSPQEQAQLVVAKEEADILIKQSLASLDFAEEQLARLEKDAASTVAGTRLLELRETIARSRAAEQEAREKLPFLPKEPYEGQMQLKETPIVAPLSGQVVELHFTPRNWSSKATPWGQSQTGPRFGFAFRLMSLTFRRFFPNTRRMFAGLARMPPFWRVPSSSRKRLNPESKRLRSFMKSENSEGKLRPGQAVSVSLPINQKVSRFVLPKSAILWDGLGNSWVYLRTSPTTFRRRQVELGPLLADEVVVERGLEVADTVAVTGVQALYGEEFRWQIQSEDDD